MVEALTEVNLYSFKLDSINPGGGQDHRYPMAAKDSVTSSETPLIRSAKKKWKKVPRKHRQGGAKSRKAAVQPPGASKPSSLPPTRCKVEHAVAELSTCPASDIVRKEDAAFCEAFSKAIWAPHWTEVKLDGEATDQEGPGPQELSE